MKFELSNLSQLCTRTAPKVWVVLSPLSLSLPMFGQFIDVVSPLLPLLTLLQWLHCSSSVTSDISRHMNSSSHSFILLPGSVKLPSD